MKFSRSCRDGCSAIATEYGSGEGAKEGIRE
jgi:hypothetical protein